MVEAGGEKGGAGWSIQEAGVGGRALSDGGGEGRRVV